MKYALFYDDNLFNKDAIGFIYEMCSRNSANSPVGLH